MKKQTFTLLLILLQFLSAGLMAQNNEGRFRLKEGDWFEVHVEQNHPESFKLRNNLHNQLFNSTYLLNYKLEKQLPNRNQQYKIRIDHFKVSMKDEEIYVGYDSYYPTFEENKQIPEKKKEFTLEVTPEGRIVNFNSDKNNPSSNVVLTEINPHDGSNNYYQSMPDMQDSFTISGISTHLMSPVYSSENRNADYSIGTCFEKITKNDSIGIKVPYIKENGVPLSIKMSEFQLILTNASFPLTNNTIIQGKVSDQKNKEIKISMLGDNPEYYFPQKNFKSNIDGSFTCPIFLKRPLRLNIQVGNKNLTTFMEPGDTLNISTIGHQSLYLEKDYYRNTKPNGYFDTSIRKSDYFTGSAAYNTMLSNEIDQYRENLPYPDSIPAIVSYCQKTTKAVNELIDSYRGKASVTCIEYFKRDWDYFITSAKLDFSKRDIKPTSPFNAIISKDYPSDYFLAVDTMPVLMNPFEWNYSYQSFLHLSQGYKQFRFGQINNKRRYYYFSLATLSGYPLYKTLANYIANEFRTGSTNNAIIEFYFSDFLNNCSDPVLNEPLKNIQKASILLEIGKSFPVKSFVLQDSSIFEMSKFKGKSVCLILLNGRVWYTADFEQTILKFKEDEVQFIFARLPVKDYNKKKFESTILGKSNVTFIELAEQDQLDKLLINGTRILMLDKWLRIVENDAEDLTTHRYYGKISEFEKSLKKTIETSRFSKEEKASVYKIVGWSFGSILLTLLIGMWIYRLRVRRIKQQETIKRRIKELEIKAIRSQMNPHFVFNALNSIQSLINGNQFKEANIYLSKFAVLLRGVLNNSEKSMVSLSDELKAVELYCQLEQLRFEFKFEININPAVNCDLIEIPGMIIQPLAENAIVHGLSPKGNQGKLSIQIERHNGDLCVGVSDNGVGLSSQANDTLSQKGFGLRLVEERLNILNLDGKMAKLTIQNKDNEPGTFAKLTIPIE